MNLELLDMKITQEHAIMNLERFYGHYTTGAVESSTTHKSMNYRIEL